jgi:hypothetical protein
LSGGRAGPGSRSRRGGRRCPRGGRCGRAGTSPALCVAAWRSVRWQPRGPLEEPREAVRAHPRRRGHPQEREPKRGYPRRTRARTRGSPRAIPRSLAWLRLNLSAGPWAGEGRALRGRSGCGFSAWRQSSFGFGARQHLRSLHPASPSTYTTTHLGTEMRFRFGAGRSRTPPFGDARPTSGQR